MLVIYYTDFLLDWRGKTEADKDNDPQKTPRQTFEQVLKFVSQNNLHSCLQAASQFSKVFSWLFI